MYGIPSYAITFGRILFLIGYYLFTTALSVSLMALVDKFELPFWIMAVIPIAFFFTYVFVIIPYWQNQDREMSRKHMREKRADRK